ncbi:MAG: rod shape-determining protein RodA [Planctomycetes bacterium]|nr:rod shape-determining protein RodA [Planctomycetota bacterium]
MPPPSRFHAVRERLGVPGAVVAIAAFLLCIAGLLLCASVDATEDKGTGYALKQGVRLFAAIPVCGFVFFVKPRWIRANAIIIYTLSVVLLALVLFVGPVINGARRWIGFGSFRFQPSDLAKIAVCLMLAGVLAGKERARNGWRVLLAIVLVLVPAALIVKEPDLGTALNLAPILVAALLVSGARRLHLLLFAGAAAAGLAILIIVGLHGYQKERIDTWWRQNELTRSEKLAQGYHLHRSKIAIGSGGFWGYGFAEGPQNKNDLLPERHTDFAFSVICEEFGFVGGIIILILESCIPFGLIILSMRIRDAFARTAIICIATQTGMQAIVNMGVATGAFPTTGIALPLVSYGGTSAMVTLASLAAALQLAASAEPALAAEAFGPGEEATALDRPRR